MPNHFRIPHSPLGPPVDLVFKTDELLTVMPGQRVRIELVVGSSNQLASLESQNFTIAPPRASIQVLQKRSGIAMLELAAMHEGKITLTANVADRPSITLHIGRHISHFEGVAAASPWAVDLLANRSNGPDLAYILAIQRLLHNAKGTDNIIDQRTGRFGSTSTYNCADVCLRVGRALFGPVPQEYQPYHQRIPENISRTYPVIPNEYIVYSDTTMGRASKAIAGHLTAGHPVRVGAVYEPYATALAGGYFQADRNGAHSVLIVASDGVDRFLYLDPLPGFSRLKYSGGLPFNNGKFECSYMGIFTMSSIKDRGTVLQNAEVKMQVISGPMS